MNKSSVIIIIIIIVEHYKALFSGEPHLKCAGSNVHLGIHSVTCNPHAYPIGKDSSPIITQSSTAVTHCILAAPQFTYPEGMES